MILRNKKRVALESDEQEENKKRRFEDQETLSDEEEFEDQETPSDEEEFEDDDEEDEDVIEELKEELKKNDGEAFKIFEEVVDQLNKQEPNIYEILKTPMRMKDKVKLVELYEIYKSTPGPSEEIIMYRNKIRKMFLKYKESFEEYNKLTEDKKELLKLESESLKKSEPKSSLKNQILSLECSPENKLSIYKKYKEYEEMDDNESSKLRSWLKWATSIPHDNTKKTNLDNKRISEILNKVYKELNNELYGMESVKEQIIVFLNAKLQHSEMKGCSLGLIGLPGTGKTSIAKCLSKCLDLPFDQISFGGVSDPEFLTGHDYTYIGSRPGEIVRSLSRMKYKNGILFLDEFEKVSDRKGIISTLLHITDFSQNNSFRDNYLADITMDLSNLWFIYSMNSLPDDSALRDRIFYIQVPGYKIDEKVNIIKKHLLPKALKNIGRNEDDVIISDENIKYLITKIDKKNDTTGVRNCEKTIKDIINKVHFLVSNKKEGVLDISFKITFDVKNVVEYPVKLEKNDLDKLVIVDKEDNFYLDMFI